ncbi:MAG: WYL domain-containing protein [Phycisphaerales bacterium]|nr:WYL domain-containing protein [Planctomycetota bacterium]
MPASAKNVSDLHRLLSELVLLRGHEQWTPRLLGKQFGVSEKTIRRDMKKLASTGFGVTFDRSKRGYKLDASTFLPPVQLTLDEALSLIVLCEDVAGRGQVGLLEPAIAAMSKIESLLPASLKADLNQIMDHVEIRLARSGSSSGENKIFEQIRGAIVKRTVLRCRYKSAKGVEPQRSFEFEPYALWFGVRAWYAIGRHRRHGELTALKLRRFQSIDPLNETFTRPPDFSADSYLGNAWQMIPGDTEYAIELRFDADFAETIADTRWHKTQAAVRHPDGTVTLRFKVAGLDEIVWWVLSMGKHCEVVQPRELRERVREEAAAMAALYPHVRERVGEGRGARHPRRHRVD